MMNRHPANRTSTLDISVDHPGISTAPLRALGRKQGYISYDDIIHIFPEAEQDIDLLDQIYTATRAAGIPFTEDSFQIQSSDENPADKGEEKENERQSALDEDHHLSNIETDNLVGMYFSDASRCPLLTFSEEVDLAKRIERGQLAREELSEARNISAERNEELKRLIDDGWDAVDHLISANSRLVISIAKKYMHRGVPFLDLIQEGNIGLMRAVKRFDYKRGYKFGTYATWWIRQAVTRALANQGRIIRLPVHRSDLLFKMLRAQHLLEQQLGREPEAAEVAQAMGTTIEKVQQIIDDAQYTLSLDMPTSFEDDSVLGDQIEDKDTPDFDEIVTLRILRQLLEQIFETLPPREVQILKLRFGLTNGKTHTLQEVGVKLGVSRERIRQIEAQAFRRLRHPEIKNKLRSYLNQAPS
jgi:RNA polymerase primary sigma factor